MILTLLRVWREVETSEAGKHFSVHRGRNAGRFLQPSGGALEEILVVLGVVLRVIVNKCFCESIFLLDIRCQMMKIDGLGTGANRKLDQRVENEINSEMSF